MNAICCWRERRWCLHGFREFGWPSLSQVQPRSHMDRPGLAAPSTKSRPRDVPLCMAESEGDSCLEGSSARTRFSRPAVPILLGHSLVPGVDSTFELRPPSDTDLVRHDLANRAGNSVSSVRVTKFVHFVRHVCEPRCTCASHDLMCGQSRLTLPQGRVCRVVSMSPCCWGRALGK